MTVGVLLVTIFARKGCHHREQYDENQGEELTNQIIRVFLLILSAFICLGLSLLLSLRVVLVPLLRMVK